MNRYFDVNTMFEKIKFCDVHDSRGLQLGTIEINGIRRRLGHDIREIQPFVDFLSKYNIKSWLEIGVFDAASFYLWKDIVDENCEFVGIDVNNFIPVDYLHPNQSFEFIQGNLNNDMSSIIEKLGDRKFDVVFIDDGHTYEDVKRDYQYFHKYANKLLIFHDYYIWNNTVGKFVDTIDTKDAEIIPAPDIPGVKAGYFIIKI